MIVKLRNIRGMTNIGFSPDVPIKDPFGGLNLVRDEEGYIVLTDGTNFYHRDIDDDTWLNKIKPFITEGIKIRYGTGTVAHYVPLDFWKGGNVVNFNNLSTLSTPTLESHQTIYHNEISGNNAVGRDYDIIRIFTSGTNRASIANWLTSIAGLPLLPFNATVPHTLISVAIK